MAKAHGCETVVEWMKIPYIPLVNDAKMVDLVERVAQRFGENQGKWERLAEPNMTGEDFAFFTGAVTSLLAQFLLLAIQQGARLEALDAKDCVL